MRGNFVWIYKTLLTRKLQIVLLSIFLTTLFISCFESPIEYTDQEAYFYDKVISNYKNGHTKFPLSSLTNFDWESCFWLPPYSYVPSLSKTILIQDKQYDLSQFPQLDVSDDGSWALIFILNNEIQHIIQGKRINWFGKYQYLHFIKNLPPEGHYDTNAIIKLNNQFEFTIKG